MSEDWLIVAPLLDWEVIERIERNYAKLEQAAKEKEGGKCT